MKVYPTPGLQTRDPVTKQLIPQEGIEVSDTDLFYTRRLRDGDVTLTAPKPATVTLPAIKGDKQ
jgi:hypothetical protein